MKYAFLILFAAVNVFANTDQTLSQALVLTAKGEITDKAVIADLTRIYKSESGENKVLAAYLLTHADQKNLAEPVLTYVDFALSNYGLERTIGLGAMARLYRLQGDQAYDTAKFDKAIAAYTNLAKVGIALSKKKGGSMRLADYATLKLGWCYVNKEQAAKAFELWIGLVSNAKVTADAISPTLMHGLGQSLAENLSRKDSDFEALTKLTLSPEQRTALFRGIIDGIPFMATRPQIALFVKQATMLPNYEEFVDQLFENANLRPTQVCTVLPLLVQGPKRELVYAKYSRLLDGCYAEYTRSKGGDKEAALALAMVLPVLKLTGPERHKRFRYDAQAGRFTEACQEGLAWINETPSAPVKEIAEACKRYVEKGSDAVAYIATALTETPTQFAAPHSPQLFLVNALSKNRALVAQLADKVLATPQNFQATLLPSLLAEQLASSDKGRAESLLAAFRKGSQAGVWSEIETKQSAGYIEGGDLAKAKASLEQQHPLTKPLSHTGAALWIAFLDKSQGKPAVLDDAARKQTTKALLKAVATGPAATTMSFAAAVELALALNLWEDAWAALATRPDAKLSEKLEAELFKAVSAGKFNPKTVAQSPRLAEIVLVGEAVHTPAKRPVLKSPQTAWGKDYVQLVTVETRSKQALEPKKDPLAEVTAWVRFLESAAKDGKRRRWTSPEMAEKSTSTVSKFCADATSRLGKLKPSAAVNPEEWKALSETLKDRLGDCQKTADVSEKRGKS